MKNYHDDERTTNDKLADFTDRILDVRPEYDKNPFAPDPELRALQKTALHLRDALGKEGPSEAVIHRMRQNIIAQWKQQEHTESRSYWKKFLSARKPGEKKWQSQQSRQRQRLNILLAAIFVLMLVSIPLMSTVDSHQPAASGQNLSISVLVAFGGLVLLTVWFFRRKP